MTEAEAIEVLKREGLNGFIATSKSHQREKPKGAKVMPPCDRFRVVVPLSRPLHSDADFKATWFETRRLFPKADEACKDAARFYFPCREVVAEFEGNPFPAKEAEVATSGWKPVSITSPPGEKGRLARATLDFIAMGAPDTQWHLALFKAATDLKEQLYSREEAIELLAKASPEGILDDSHDIPTIDDVYFNRESRYGPRLQEAPGRPLSTPNSGQYIPASEAERQAAYEESERERRTALENALPFIGPSFDGKFHLTKGLTVIGAQTGRSKTTTACNVIARVIVHQPHKQVVVVSNESSTADYANLIACILLKQPHSQFCNGALPPQVASMVEEAARRLFKQLHVEDSSRADTSSLEGVKSVLEWAASPSSNVSLVLIDYLQNIVSSAAMPGAQPFEISKSFGTYLKDLARRAPLPIVVFGQMHPKTGTNSDYSSRFQNDRQFANHAFSFIEVVPNFETGVTEFIFHKARYNLSQPGTIPVKYVGGRYEQLSNGELRARAAELEQRNANRKNKPQSPEAASRADAALEALRNYQVTGSTGGQQ
jgi:hypothetical protein